MKIKNRSHRYEINRPRPKHTIILNKKKYQYDDAYMYKQHQSNI